jgi:hypothetical protein
MLYDLIAFKSYICFYFQNLSIYDLYMSYYWTIHQIYRLSEFLVVSMFLETAKSVWTGHVWPLARTYPAFGVLGYMKGVGYRVEP